MRPAWLPVAVLAASVVACSRDSAPPVAPAGGATAHTVAANRAVAESLPLGDPHAFEDARRGFIGSDSPVRIPGPEGRAAWDLEPYAFIQGVAPPTVNPSLWRQAQLDSQHGLFEVVPGIWQVRGYDLSNMTLIEGNTGWIVVDPLTVAETAAAALALARKHLGDRPVSAVIFTHSHVDHFGGVDGVLPPGPSSVPIIAPAGFLDEATRENVLAGVAMGRRALYMYGSGLPRNATGHVDAGLGKGVPFGSIGIREPTVLIDRTPQPMEIDGVRFVFQDAPHSEAPAALTLYLPDHKAWGSADLVPHTLHNLYTLRGTKVRDALEWSGHLDRALELFGDVEVMFGGHQWPVWGNERPLHPRPDAAAREPGLHVPRDRRAARVAVGAAHALRHARLLRHGATQRQGRVPGLLRLVRRESREPESVAAGRSRCALCGGDGRRREGARTGAGSARCG